MPGTTELIIIFAVLILLFGANKLPRLGGAIGESIKNFKRGLRPEEQPRVDGEQEPPRAKDPQ